MPNELDYAIARQLVNDDVQAGKIPSQQLADEAVHDYANKLCSMRA